MLSHWIDIARQDVAYAIRGLKRSPGFTVAAVASLALGVGANGAIFSVLDRLVIQTPPGVVDASNIKRLNQRFFVPLTREVRTRNVFSYPEYRAIAQSEIGHAVITGYASGRMPLEAGGVIQEVAVTYVLDDYFSALGVRPEQGRFFTAGEYRGDEDTQGIVISDRLWGARFNRAPNILGRLLTVGSARFRVIGVAAKPFLGVALDASDLWLPYRSPTNGAQLASSYAKPYDLRLQLLARNLSNADEVRLTASRALREFDVVNDAAATTIMLPIANALDPQRDGSTISVVDGLAAAAIIILLIACANTANLLFVRASQRHREIAIRTALGVSRTRLMSQMLAECAVLGAFAAAVALVLIAWTSTALRNALLPGISWAGSAMTWRTVAVAGSLGLIAACAAGTLPVTYAWSADIASGLRTVGPDRTRRGSHRRAAMLVVQTALSLVLVTAAGLFVSSLRHVEAVWIGDHADDVVLASLPFGFEPGDSVDNAAARIEEIGKRIGGIPGVAQMAMSAMMPVASVAFSRTYLPGQDSIKVSPGVQTFITVVTPGYTDVMGIRLLRGRDLRADDTRGNAPVMLVSAAMAQQYWPGENAIGKCVIVGSRTDVCRTVVGIVEDTRAMHIVEPLSLRYYLPLDQVSSDSWTAHVIMVRATHGRLGAVLPLMHAVLATARGQGPPWTVQTLSDVLAPQMRPWRLSASLFGALGLLALTVAVVGIYGTVAYSVTQRTHEIGVRLALGASPIHIIRLVLRDGLRSVCSGVLIGLIITLAMGRAAQTLLYGISPRDPIVMLAATSLLLLFAAFACVLPAGAAVRVDPTIALANDA